MSSVESRSSTASLSPSFAALDTILGTFSKFDEIEGESRAESGDTKHPEMGDSSDGWLTEPGIDDEASFFVSFNQSDFDCSRGGFRYTISGGNSGTVINVDKGPEAITDEEGRTAVSPLLSHSPGSRVLDLEGDWFGNGCCLREMFLDLVSVSRA